MVKVIKNSDEKNKMASLEQFRRKKIGLLMLNLIAICIIISIIPSVAALNFDNIKEYEKNDKYGTIKIYNSFIIPKIIKGELLAEYTLLENTDQCLIDCSAEGTVTINKPDKLFYSIDFKDKNNITKDIKALKVYIINDVDEYIEVPIFKNKTDCVINNSKNVCNTYQEIAGYNKQKRTIKQKVEYNGEVLDKGTYYWRIEGKKQIGDSLDWILSALGYQFNEWAWWGGLWTKKADITLKGESATVYNFIRYFEIPYDSDMQADYDDLRFTDESGVTEYPYDFDFVNTSTVGVWVRIPILNTGDNIIQMYYGNPSATAGNSSADTFQDVRHVLHFTDGSLTNKGTDDTYTNQSTPTFFNDTYLGGAFTSDTQGDAILSSYLLDTSDQNFTIIIYLKGSGENNNYFFVGYTGAAPTSFQCAEDLASGTLNNVSGQIACYGGVGWTYVGIMNNSRYNQFVLQKSGSTTTGYINGLSFKYNIPFTTLSDQYLRIGWRHTDVNPSNFRGNITDVRFYYENEPFNDNYISADYQNLNISRYSIGSEEDPPINSAPKVTLNSPVDNYNTSSNNVQINCSANDTDGNLVNLTVVINGVNNYTVYNTTSSQNLSIQTTIYGIIDGYNNWTCTATDSENEKQQPANRTILIDNTDPIINIIYPSIYYNYSYNVINLNYTYYDLHPGYCWKTAPNYTIVNAGSNFTSNISSIEGLNTFNLFCNDTFGNVVATSTTFRVDRTAPTFTNLASREVSNETYLYIDIDASDSGVGVQSYDINWTTNFTINRSSGELRNSSKLIIGVYFINVTVNDTLGNLASGILNINVTNYSVGITVTMTAPTKKYTGNRSNTVSSTGIANYGYIVNYTNYLYLFDEITGVYKGYAKFDYNVSGSLNNYNASNTYNFGDGFTGNWSFNARYCNNNSYCSFALTNLSYMNIMHVYYLIFGYVNSTSSTKNDNFNITFEAFYPMTYTFFIFNNTKSSASFTNLYANTYIVTKDYTSPYIDEQTNYTYYWNNIYTYGELNTSTFNLSVIPLTEIIVTNETCGAGYFEAINYTFADSKNFTKLDVDVQYNFRYGVTDFTTLAYGTLESIDVLRLCINDTYDHFKLGYGEIVYSTDNYATRKFYMYANHSLSNITTEDYTLYDLYNSYVTTFTFTVQDSGLNPYKGYYVALNRWYPELNEYRVVEMGKTDDAGQVVFKVHTEDVDYKIGVYTENGNLVHLFNSVRMVCASTPCEYTLTVPSTSNQEWQEFLGLENSLTFTDGIFSFSFNDPSQSTQKIKLDVYRQYGDSDILICSDNVSSYQGTLVCNVSSYSGSLRAVAYRTASPEVPIAQKIVNTASSVLKSGTGLFISFLVIVLLIFMGIASPVIAIILAIVGMVIAVMLGVVTYQIAIIVGVLGGIVIHFMKRAD